MGWIGNVFILIGMYLVGEKNRTGFLFSITGEAIWAVWAACVGLYDLSFICALFCVMASLNWRKWGPPKCKKTRCMLVTRPKPE